MGECDKLKLHISDFIENALDPTTYAAIEAHLANCSQCKALEEKIVQLKTLMHKLPQHSCAKDFNLKLHARIHNRPSRVEISWNFRKLSYALSFVVVVIIAILSIDFSGGEKTNMSGTAQPSSSGVPVSNQQDVFSNEPEIDIKTKDGQALAADSLRKNQIQKDDNRAKYVGQTK